MKEVIVRLTSDHIKVKGAEYVQDLVRCKDCKHGKYRKGRLEYICLVGADAHEADFFCKYGEVRDESR